MSDVAIRVENLSKRYRLGVQEEKHDTLVGSLIALIKKPGQNLQRLRRLTRFSDNGTNEKDILWALQDVSFEVKQGEVVGVIGRNGAGKSTLLKILSRITYPTTGRVELHGRVASLLEVGTGFHPELTGRENIYLNGTILGMRKKEIDHKFDEIIDFSGVEKFVDTPVKHYSSGMRVRLAFAVAAYLEPEILLIDEVLAVGDVEFQRKCIGKMEDVANSGRTVIFVSHNMQAIKNLCPRSVLFNKGLMVHDGFTEDVIQQYLSYREKLEISSTFVSTDSYNYPHFTRIEVQQSGVSGSIFEIDKPIQIVFELETCQETELAIGFAIINSADLWIHHSSDEFSEDERIKYSKKRICEIPANGLATGKYYVYATLGRRNYKLFQELPNILKFEVEFTGKMADKTAQTHWKGVCGPGLPSWSMEK